MDFDHDDVQGADTTRVTEALCYASLQGQVAAVQALLLGRRADPTAFGSLALRVAAVAGSTAVVRLLLEDGRAHPGAEGGEGLVNAALYGHDDVVRALLADGRADVGRVSCQDRKTGQADPTSRKFTGCAPGTLHLVRAEVRWRRRRQWLRASPMGAHP
jgi:hypothetical protein